MLAVDILYGESVMTDVVAPPSKTSAILAIHRSGITSTSAIIAELKDKYGIDATSGTVSGILHQKLGPRRLKQRRQRQSRRVVNATPGVPPNKASAILAVYHDGVHRPADIVREVKSRYDVDVSAGCVSGTLYNKLGPAHKRNNRRITSTMSVDSAPRSSSSRSPMQPSQSSGVSAEGLVAASRFVAACGGVQAARMTFDFYSENFAG